MIKSVGLGIMSDKNVDISGDGRDLLRLWKISLCVCSKHMMV